MMTSPPLAHDRLVGLASLTPSLLANMEEHGRLPPRMSTGGAVQAQLEALCREIATLLDRERFPWLDGKRRPTSAERALAASIIADRACGANADPIIRNEQEKRQKRVLREYFLSKGYKEVSADNAWETMAVGSFMCDRSKVVTVTSDAGENVNLPVDAIVRPKGSRKGDLPLFIEAKSAGDFANVNKRRKEESKKAAQLAATYGPVQGWTEPAKLVLFLCGYFGESYLRYSKDNGMDWVWEHRVADFGGLGI